MKKLKIALTVLFAMSCSLFLFACGGGSGKPESGVSDIDLSGMKTTYSESDTELDVKDLVVRVRYQNAEEKLAADGSIDFSNWATLTYNASGTDADGVGTYRVEHSVQWKTPGNYTITVVPNGQRSFGDTSVYLNTKTYTITIEHAWGAKDANNRSVCSVCGAAKTEADISTKLYYEAWSGGPTVTGGGLVDMVDASYPTATVGKLSLGTQITVRGTAVVPATGKNASGGANNVYYFPMLGVARGDLGMIQRNDNWMIYDGINGAPRVTGLANQDCKTGALPDDAQDWLVYQEGTICSSTDYLTTAEIELIWNYRTDGVMECTTNNITAGKSVVRRFHLPLETYDALLHGEFIEVNLTSYEKVENLIFQDFNIEPLEAQYYSEGMMFDPDTIVASADYEQKSGLAITSYSIEADTLDAEGATVVHDLRTEELTADMKNFRVSFSGVTIYLSEGLPKEAPAATAKSLITVNASSVRWASTAPITVNGAEFYGDKAEYTYGAKETNVTFFATGSANKLTTAQKTALSATTDYFIAVRLYGLADLTGTPTVTGADKASITVNGSTADLVASLAADAKELVIKGLQESDIHIDLENLAVVPAVSSLVEGGEDITLDNGGEFTITYTGNFSGSAADYRVISNGTAVTLDKKIEGDGSALARNLFWVTKVEFGATQIKVSFRLAHPNLGRNIPSYTINLDKKEGSDWNTLASDTVYYSGKASENYTENGFGHAGEMFAFSEEGTLYVVKALEAGNIKSGVQQLGINLTGTLFEESKLPTELTTAYDLSVTLGADGSLAFTGSNAATKAAKLAFYGAGTTIDNSRDYDHGAFIVVELDLEKLGLTGTYYYELMYQYDELRVFTVTSAEDVITVTATEVDEDECEPFTVPGGCVVQGVEAYQAKIGGGVFIAGAKFTPASGAHKFGAYENDQAVCSVCGAVSYKVALEEEGYYENVVALPANRPVANPATAPDMWWQNRTAEVPVSGDFVVRYQWTYTNDGYAGCGGVEMHNEDGWFGYRVFEDDYNPAVEGCPLITAGSTPTSVHTKNGEPVDDVLTAGEEHYTGTADVTVYRVGSTLTIIQVLTLDENNDVLKVVTTIPGFTTKDAEIHLNSDIYWLKDILFAEGTVTTEFEKSGDVLNTEIGPVAGAVKNGISLTTTIKDQSNDWGTYVIKTKSDIRITLPNLDPFFNTSGEGGFPQLGGTFANEGGLGDRLNGGTWDCFFSNEEIYFTLSVSVDEGVKYFKDGVLVVWYKPDSVWDAAQNITIADFCAYVLGEIEESGFTYFANYTEGATATGLFMSTAMNDAAARELYESTHPVVEED